jgi:hypothetical protein
MSRSGVRMVAADRSVALRLGCAAIIAAAPPCHVCGAERSAFLTELDHGVDPLLSTRLLSRASRAAPEADEQIRTVGFPGAGPGYDRPEPANGSAEPNTGRMRLAGERRD